MVSPDKALTHFFLPKQVKAAVTVWLNDNPISTLLISSRSFHHTFLFLDEAFLFSNSGLNSLFLLFNHAHKPFEISLN
jgi:hypothetical protein